MGMSEFRPSQYFIILGNPIPKWKVYLSVASVFILICGGAGSLFYIMLKNRNLSALAYAAATEVAESPVALKSAAAPQTKAAAIEGRAIDRVQTRNLSVRSLSAGETRSPLRRLLEQHLGVTGFDQVNSYLAEGTVGVDATNEIVLMGRASNLYKYKAKYSDSGAVIEFGFDGSSSWLRGVQSKLSREAAQYYTSLALLEGSMTHLAWSYLSADAAEYGLNSVLELQPEEAWNGRSCAVVLSHGILPIPIYHYIDAETYREVYRRATLTNIEGDTIEVGVVFEAPEQNLHASFPQGYQLYIDGELHDDVTFSKFRLDRVILSSLFDPAADCMFTKLKPRL